MITIHVNAPEGVGVPRDLIRRALRETLRREGHLRAELSVTLVGDAEITRLHERYLGSAGVTDVLAFALHEGDDEPLGDVYIGHAQARRQAADTGVEPDEELVRLAVHGALHVLGYDHPPGPERNGSEMFRVQEEVVRGLRSKT